MQECLYLQTVYNVLCTSKLRCEASERSRPYSAKATKGYFAAVYKHNAGI